jgi:hypothetical protein
MKTVFLLLSIFLLSCDEFDERSVVRVHMGNYFASGFFYSPGVVVTSAHLADDGTEGAYVQYFDENGIIQTVEPLDIYADFEKDRMFLVVDYPGTPVHFCHVPVGTLVQLWYWTEEKPSNTQGYILWESRDKYWTSDPGGDGKSGGPVVKGNCVIGYLDGGTAINTGIILKIDEN